jgi:hypothetical protein
MGDNLVPNGLSRVAKGSFSPGSPVALGERRREGIIHGLAIVARLALSPSTPARQRRAPLRASGD